MSRKLAIVFSEIGASVEGPLMHYAKKVLEKNQYDVCCIDYAELDRGVYAEMTKETVLANGTPANKLSKDRLLSFVKKAQEFAYNQLHEIDFKNYDKLIFVSWGIGTVVAALYAKQVGVKPYHVMISPLDYAFQFITDENGSVFAGTEDSLINYVGIQDICKELSWDLHSFKGGNHYLESDNIDMAIEYLKRFVATLDNIIEDIDISVYDYDVLNRKQQMINLSEYKGKVLLIVNTATGCGFTPQYQTLEKIYRKYQKQGFEILDFPCNQFGNQAKGTEDEIYSFCTSRYDITFEQFAKICVNGDKQSELFKYLKARKGFKGFDMSKPDSIYLVHKLQKEVPDYESTSDIKWNFTKFLINRQGQVIERFEPTTDLNAVEEAVLQLL